jgi:predicted Fe-S protein YdhL (DUF1289 family)
MAEESPWQRDEPESPCIKICLTDPVTGLCLGCHRRLDEIAAWGRLSPAARRAIMAELPARAEAAKATRRKAAHARRARRQEG